MTEESATSVVRSALAGSGLELVESCEVAAYDARAPESHRSSVFLSGAKGVIVAASAGTLLWRRFAAAIEARPSLLDEEHPYDSWIAKSLDRADAALSGAGVRFRRFDAAVHAEPRVDFRALGELVGFGKMGPFGLLIHREHGPWWALRGAWLVDRYVEPPVTGPHPCSGCSAPCIGGDSADRIDNLAMATAEARQRCVVGQASRYEPDQIGYHYDRAPTVARLRRP